MVAVAFAAVTHPVGAAPDQGQAQAAGSRVGQRFCRDVLWRTGWVEGDAGVSYLDARFTGRGPLADFDADVDRLGARRASAVGEHVRQDFMEGQLNAIDLGGRHAALSQRGGEPLASVPYLVPACGDGKRVDLLCVNPVMHRSSDGGPLRLGAALENRDQFVDAGGLQAHYDGRVGADNQHHLSAALLDDLRAFEQRTDADRRKELETGHVDDDALLRSGGESFELASDRFGARDVEAAQDDDLAQVVTDVGMTDGHYQSGTSN